MILQKLHQKYDLVCHFYAGDQNCDEPAILKLYDPDRAMIGVNFYVLNLNLLRIFF